jgi:glycosyltransferase involved in cell wall biosynthesis
VDQANAEVAHFWLPYDTSADFQRSLGDTASAELIFKAAKPDLIIFSDCCPFSNLAAREAASVMGIPYIVVVGFAAPYLADRFKPALKILARQYARAGAVIAVSEENLRVLRQHFGLPQQCGQVIHYGRPAHFFAPRAPAARLQLRSELQIPASGVVSLTTARLTSVKGYHYQLAAIDTLHRSGWGKNNYFVWLGTGDLHEQLHGEIESRGLGAMVKLAGHRWNAADWYDIADFYVLTSEHEGMPLAIMEAMAKGLPVAATAVSGIPEELGSTGKLLPDPKQNPAAVVRELASVLQLWSQDSALRDRLGRAANRRATDLFQESRMINSTIRVIRSFASQALPQLTPSQSSS